MTDSPLTVPEVLLRDARSPEYFVIRSKRPFPEVVIRDDSVKGPVVLLFREETEAKQLPAFDVLLGDRVERISLRDAIDAARAEKCVACVLVRFAYGEAHMVEVWRV